MKYFSSVLFLILVFTGCSTKEQNVQTHTEQNKINKEQTKKKKELKKRVVKVIDCKVHPDNMIKFECYKKRALKGDIKAQSWVAYFYNIGKIVPKDTKLANEWFLKAANGGDVYSQKELGINFLAVKDYKNAVLWLEKAANSGDIEAQRELAYIYDKGYLGVKDLNKAFMYFQKAALQNDVYAINELAYYYKHGWAVKKDFKKISRMVFKSCKYG